MIMQQARQWISQLFSQRGGGGWTRVPTQEVPTALGDPLIPPSASPPSQQLTSMPTVETPTRVVVPLRTTAYCALGHFSHVAQPRQVIAIEVFPAG
ncbi:TPA: hypothetical protein ACH3X3_013011 [Trebouxia sp. C0006]